MCPAPKRWLYEHVRHPLACTPKRARVSTAVNFGCDTPKTHRIQSSEQSLTRPPKRLCLLYSLPSPLSARRNARTGYRQQVLQHPVDFRGLSWPQSPYPTRAVLPALADRTSLGLGPLQGLPLTVSKVSFVLGARPF